MGPGILSETTVGKHNPPCHLQMPTKALSCKKEAICEHGPEAPSCPVGQGSFKMDCFKVEKCSMVRRVQIWHSFWKSCWKGRPSSVLSAFSLKSSISDGMGVHKCIQYGQLACLEGTMNAERNIKVLEQHMLPSRRRVFKQDNAKPHTAAITTAWLVVEESECWIGLPAIQIFHL